MTLSSERRGADQETALRIMATDLGDEALFKKEWSRFDARFEALAATTWAQLQERGLVVGSPVQNEPRYALTEAGWVAGLRLNGTLDDAVFRGRCVAFIKFLKSLVDGRHGEWPSRVHYQNSRPTFRLGGR